MLNAAPGEVLDLTQGHVTHASEAAPTDQLTSRKMKERKKIVEHLRQQFRERLRSKGTAGALPPSTPSPRYDGGPFVAGS